jgi:transposase
MVKKPLVSDELWNRVEPLIPKPKRKNRHVQYAGRKPVDDRAAFEAIVFALKTGVPWRYLPATQIWPSGMTCWRRLMKWHRAGVWKRLLESVLIELQAQGKIDWSRAVVDASFVRAPGGGRETGPNPTDRRKKGSKHHLLTDANGIPLSVALTKANRNEITQLLKLVESIPSLRGRRGRPRKRPDRVQGDRGYDSEPHRKALKKNAYHS